MRVFQRLEGRYHFSAHRGREVAFKDTHFGTSESPSHFANETNRNSLIMCSRVMNVQLGFLKREGLFVNRAFFFLFFLFLFFFIFFWHELLFGLYPFIRSSSIEYIFYWFVFQHHAQAQLKDPVYPFSFGSSTVACLALKALPIATLSPVQIPQSITPASPLH
jgi:hypothetical protein